MTPSEPDQPASEGSIQSTAQVLATEIAENLRSGGWSGVTPTPSDPAKAVHNEVTKLKATTLNSVALAFLIGGGVAPLVSWASTGVSPLQATLGIVWLSVGILLHYGARRILGALVP